MTPEPNLRIVVDGDSTKLYQRGNKVTGRVVLAAEEEHDITSLTLSFMGTVTTRTTRPFYVTGNDADATKSRREYEECICLFNFEQELLLDCTVAPNKTCWVFEFKFPEATIPKYSRWHHGPKYCKDPHPLPPSFQTYTNSPGGQAMIKYFLQAQLVRRDSNRPLKVYETLSNHPTPDSIAIEARIIPRVLYAQIWKPLAASRTFMDKTFSKLSGRAAMSSNSPRIVPTIYYPEKTTPGQHIPILLSLINSNDPFKSEACGHPQCELSSVTVSLGTHTSSMCGQPATQPEDAMSKYITCVSKTDLKQPITFGEQVKLTNSFRLVDNVECVSSFKTYTITRRYDLAITVGIKYKDRAFTIRCTTRLEILPRVPRELLPSTYEYNYEAEIDPLPLYVPREQSKEFAPDYYSIYPLANIPSSSSSASLACTSSRASRVVSGHSTPAVDFKQMTMDECPIYMS